mmetsp:Transcript_25395/g.85312  ORF Transcript_25395/g.85312 Transcript_25395/m.85312 type:complete len:110 (-) Transcript_25395:1247-1576(-)
MINALSKKLSGLPPRPTDDAVTARVVGDVWTRREELLATLQNHADTRDADYGLPLDDENPLTLMQRAECLLALAVLSGIGDESFPQPGDFLDPDRIAGLSRCIELSKRR